MTAVAGSDYLLETCKGLYASSKRAGCLRPEGPAEVMRMDLRRLLVTSDCECVKSALDSQLGLQAAVHVVCTVLAHTLEVTKV